MASSNLAAGLTVETSLGETIPGTLYFFRQAVPDSAGKDLAEATNTWSYRFVCDGGFLQGGLPGKPYIVASGTLSFDVNGRLTTNLQDSTVVFSPWRGVSGQYFYFDFGTPTRSGGVGPEYYFSMPGPSVISRIETDRCLEPGP